MMPARWLDAHNQTPIRGHADGPPPVRAAEAIPPGPADRVVHGRARLGAGPGRARCSDGANGTSATGWTARPASWRAYAGDTSRLLRHSLCVQPRGAGRP